jgi:putative DNA methylase
MSDAPGSAGFQPASAPPQSAGKNAGAPRGIGPKTTHLGWYSRGYLPHFDEPGRVQAVSFRLADSLPSEVVLRLEAQLLALPPAARLVERRRLLEAALDRGHGSCHLAHPPIASATEAALHHFDGERYRLLAWCVMPNHVHALLEPLSPHSLAGIMQSWKGFTARTANQLLGRVGAFWQREYHDRFIRDATHLAAVRRYIEENPVTAGLIANAADWSWSSASWERRLSAGIVTRSVIHSKPAG